MRLIQCMHTQNDCYISNVKEKSNIKPVGIVVHSTGANNTNLKRYVQPSNNDPQRAELLKLIGTNTSNSWNRSGISKAVHYFIGKLADGTIATTQNLPENFYCWGCGKGAYGSYNYSPTMHIQFEICEDNLQNPDYFKAVMKEAQELCADICLRYDWSAKVVISHREAHAKGYASNHSDIYHWLSWHNKTMDWFRAEVQALIDEAKKPEPAPEPEPEVKGGYKPSVNEVVEYIGTIHYSNANSTSPSTCKPGLAKVTRIYNGLHPYHLINTAGERGGVYGWVDATYIVKYEEPAVEVVPEPTPEPEPEVVAPEPAPAPEPEVMPTPEPEIEVVPTPEPEPEVEIKPEPKPIIKEDPIPTIDPEFTEPEPKKEKWYIQLIKFILNLFKKGMK